MQAFASVILLLGAAQGIFFSMVLLALPDGNRQANRWLAVLLSSFAINMAGTAIHDLHIVLSVPHLGLVQTPFGVLIGIGFLFFVKNFTEKNFKMRWWHWLYVTPFFLNVLYFMPFYLLPVAEKIDVLEASFVHKPDFWVRGFNIANFINAVYIFFTVAIILRHERHIRQVFSNTENKSLKWLMQFIFAGVATFIICVILSIYDIGFADNFSNLVFSGVIYIMGYRAIKQPEIFKNIPQEVMEGTDDPALLQAPAKYEKSGLTETKAQHLLVKLDTAMSKEKIYLEPELTLPQLAESLGASAHQVSQLLNQQKQESFFDFVNRHRVEHFKTAVIDPANAHLSILAIAFDSGFNSKAAFNSVFKKMTGTTPSAFRSQ